MKKFLGLSLSMALLALAVSPAFASSGQNIGANVTVSYTATANDVTEVPDTLAGYNFTAYSAHTSVTSDFSDSVNSSEGSTLAYVGQNNMAIKVSMTDLVDNNATTADKELKSVADYDALVAAGQGGELDTYKFVIDMNTQSETSSIPSIGASACAGTTITIADFTLGVTDTATDIVTVSGIPADATCSFSGEMDLVSGTLTSGQFAAGTDTDPSATLTISLT